jgi:hypothetical protein
MSSEDRKALYQEAPLLAAAYFDGETYDPALDKHRLAKQLQAVYNLMHDGGWRTLREIADALSIPEASASARLRDLRKTRFGSHRVERQRRGEEKRGLFEYRVEIASQ